MYDDESGERGNAGDTQPERRPSGRAGAPRQSTMLGNHFFRLLDALPAGAYTCDQEGLITYYNRRATEIWGRAPVLNDAADRYCGSFRLFAADGTPLEHEQCWMALALRNRRSYNGEEIQIERPDGRRVAVLAHANPLSDEHDLPIGAVNVLVDISELKRTHDELSQANHAKDQFLATLSHELRNPLAPIRNSVELLRAKAFDPALRSVVEMVDRQVLHLTRLVNDLLDSARMSSGELRLCKVPAELRSIVRDGIEHCRAQIDDAGIRFTPILPSVPLMVEADEVRLAQVVANLLDNAAKYTPAGGAITLELTAQGSEAVMAVRDSGIGMASELMPRVFDIFVRGTHAPVRAQGGLGVGLALVRQLVELHGGTVNARSAGPGKGSEFVVRLPLMSDDEALSGAAAPSDSGTAGPEGSPVRRRVLVVDDNVDVTESAMALLTLTGHEVRTANSGAAALSAADVFHPQLVLLDIGLPDMDGYEVARRLRMQRWAAHALLVAVTGWGNETDRLRSREAGFDHHLVKPVDYGAVTRLLDEPTHQP